MESRNLAIPSLPQPPRALNALINGFNAVASNVIVILFPVLLDLFLWLGPRLKGNILLAPLMDVLPEIQAQTPADQFKLFSQFFTDFNNGFNLFSIFRTFPMGVFSLMSVNLSPNSPLGIRYAIDIPNWLVAFGYILIITFFGWIAGSLYFRAVSKIALKSDNVPGVFRSLLHGTFLSGTWLLFFVFANLPLFIVLVILSMLDGLLRTILIIILALPVSWLVLTIFFSFYGIFVFKQNALSSIASSFRLVRYGLPPLGWFAMLAIVINQGMDILWHAAPAESWMAGVGIFGHAFVTTSLLAASFIFYRDLTIWIETVLQSIKNNNNSPAQA